MQSDILYPVSSSKWTGPVVHVPKSDGSIRVCRDYKAINECIEDDVYKLVMYKTCLPCYLGMELTLIPFQQLIWPVLSTNYFWMKSQLSYSSTLEKVY